MKPSNHRTRRLDVPTRPAENEETDRFETQVRQSSENLFYTLDKNTDPSGLDWVLVELADGKLAWELYDGQNFVALVRILEFYKLPNGSEQRREPYAQRFNKC